MGDSADENASAVKLKIETSMERNWKTVEDSIDEYGAVWYD
jgi:hypothetical protein